MSFKAHLFLFLKINQLKSKINISIKLIKNALWVLFVLTYFFICSVVQAADGDKDPSFLPGVNGFDDYVRVTAIQSDGKIIVGGDFTRYGGNIGRNRIARLNIDGSLDMSFDPGTGANDEVYWLVVLSDGKIMIGGEFTTYNGVTRNCIARLNSDGTLDATFDSSVGANGIIGNIAIQSDNKIVIGGYFTSYDGVGRSHIARLNTDGTLDATFNPGTGFNANIYGMDLQSDGKIVVGGNFTTYNGASVNYIARINSDGTRDATFNMGSGFNVFGFVYDLAVQTDDKIVVGGNFNSYNGTAGNKLVRLNSDGTLDGSFSSGSGTVGDIECIDIQSDEKIIIGGYFSVYNGVTRNYIARLNIDGSLDGSFDPGVGIVGDEILNISIQSDGEIIIGGYFSGYAGVSKNFIARLNIDGTLDTDFNPGNGAGADDEVENLSLQSNGKIIIGGYFPYYNAVATNNIARLNTDGTLDTSFNPGTGANSFIKDNTIDSDGKIIIGGNFTSFNGIGRNRIARLNADGSLDTSFNPGTGANGLVNTVEIQSDGKIMIGGSFTNYDGSICNRIARLNADGTLDTSFNLGTGANGNVYAIFAQYDDKLVVAGNFTSYDGVSANRIIRLNADGTQDTGFNFGTGANNYIHNLNIQPDGKIIIIGFFTTYNGSSRNKIARLNADGSLDSSFDPGVGPSSYVYDVDFQFDGKMILVGDFIEYDGNICNRIARLNTDGSFDTSFNAGVGIDDYVSAVLLQPDGDIIIGGWFENYNNIYTRRITRVLSSFQTISPYVFTGSRGSTTSTSIVMKGFVTGTGGDNPERVIEWGTTSGNYINSCTAGIGGEGSYSCIISGLSYDETYYIRARATNSIGTSYGQELVYSHIAQLIEQIVPNEFQGGGVAQGWKGDEDTWAYQLPFDFTFYGVTYTAGTSIGITSNGQICFEDSTTCADYENDIASTSHGPFIVPLWMDLDSTTTGDVYITENPDNFVIRWESEEYNVPGISINFEAILYSNGNIKFNYGNQSAPSSIGASVGLAKGDGNYVASVYDGRDDFDNIDTSAWGDYAVPVVTAAAATLPATSITATTAIGNANVSDTGGDNPNREIQWGITTGVYTESCSAGVGATGDYSCNLTALNPETTYYFRARVTNSAGVSYGNELNFTTLANSGSGEPQILTSSPPNSATGIQVDSDLALNFDEAVKVGIGNVLLKKKNDDSVIETIDITSANITGWGTPNLIINPSNNLPFNTEIYVNIDSGAILDNLDNPFLGISDNSTWSFITIADDSTEETSQDLVNDDTDEDEDDLSVNIIRIKDITRDSLKLRVKVKHSNNSEFDFKVEIKNKKTGQKQKYKFKKIKASDNGRCTLNIKNLLPGTEYVLRVKVSEKGEDDYSDFSDFKKAKTQEGDIYDSGHEYIDEKVNLEAEPDLRDDNLSLDITNEELASLSDDKNNSKDDPKDNGEQIVNNPDSELVFEEENNKNTIVDQLIGIAANTAVIGGLLWAVIKTFSTAPNPFIPLTPAPLRASLDLRLRNSIRRRFFGMLNLFPFVNISSKDRISFPFYRYDAYKVWGVVFDSYTKQPLADAIVYLMNYEKERMVDLKITDENGRFGFLIGEDGKYAVRVKIGEYSIATNKSEDSLYGDLYTEPIDLKKGDVFDLSISLEAKNFNWNNFTQKVIVKYNSFFFRFIKNLLNLVYIIGIIISVYNIIYYPGLLNYLMLIFYVSLIFYNILFKDNKKFGSVIQKINRSPLPFSVVALHDISTGERINFAISDVLGRYYLLMKDGNYVLKLKCIDIKGNNFEKEGMESVTRGIFKKDLEI